MFGQMAAESSSSGGGVSVALVLFGIAFTVVHLAGMWKVLGKGGQPGAFALLLITGCLAPFAYLPVLRMVGRPSWWVVLMYIPIVNIIVLLVVSIDLARSFGKGVGYGIGLWILSPIFFIMLGFGSSTYRGQANAQVAAA